MASSRQNSCLTRPLGDGIFRYMPTAIRPADTYRQTNDLWVVTSYFNPEGYLTKRQNYDLFRERIVAAGIPLLTVECSLGDHPFELPAGPDVHRVLGRDVMWQKERLINVAISKLPDWSGIWG